MKTTQLRLFFFMMIATPTMAFADFSQPLSLTCERVPSMPNHYSATIVGPTPRGNYSLTLIEKYYGMEIPKVFRLRQKSLEILESKKASVRFIGKNESETQVEITLQTGETLNMNCQPK